MKKILITGIIGWDVTPSGIRDALKEANGGPVDFEVSTPGGFIAPGLEIFNMIRNYPGDVSCVLTGYAMSMGSYIPLAVALNVHKAGKIRAEDNAVYMIHNARGGAWGDHNDVLSYGTYLKGLSGVIAKAYVKRTGKSLEEVTDLMDKETFFFGDEMVTHGFVDEIIETGNDTDKENAMLSARASFDDAMGKMAAEQAQVRADLERASAMINMLDTPPAATIVTPPASAGNFTQEVRQMGLKTLLAADPAAQAEYNADIQAAEGRGKQAGSDEVQARITIAAPFLKSTDYPPAVAETAVKVITGEVPAATLTTVVTAVDAVKEINKGNAAAAAAAPATPASPAPVAVEGLVSDDTALDALVATAKAAEGRV